MFDNQELLILVIISSILMTLSFDSWGIGDTVGRNKIRVISIGDRVKVQFPTGYARFGGDNKRTRIAYVHLRFLDG